MPSTHIKKLNNLSVLTLVLKGLWLYSLLLYEQKMFKKELKIR